MKTTLFQYLLIACLFLTSSSCENQDTKVTKDDESAELNQLKSEIERLAAEALCSDAFSCKYIGLGSKPCGGPWEYLVYSTSIDSNELEQLVKDYNSQEKAFNKKWGVISDCALANPPVSLNCENNICIAMY